LADWSETDRGSRRVGLVHGLLNVTATSLFALSLVQRRQGARAAGRRASAVGYLLAMAGAYLGGHLVYGEQIGVDRAANQKLPEGFSRLLRDDELPENEPRGAVVDGTPVVVVRRAGVVSALAAVCSHAGGPLAEGRLVDDGIECPWHGSVFSLRDGSVRRGPSTHTQPCLQARIVDGWIEVRRAPRE
jgi:nitrite reductase/ring-hydroxylating ferredoxin subunit